MSSAMLHGLGDCTPENNCGCYKPAKPVTPDPAQVAAQITELSWDDGNATGLDGWIGPGRGAGDVDYEAERARARSEAKVIEIIRAALEQAWDEGLDAGRDRWMDAREFGDAPVNPYAKEGVQ